VFLTVLLGAALAQPLPAAGVAAMEAAHCHLCHDVPQVEAAPRTTSCTDCHTWIRAVAADPVKREKAAAVFPLWERYERSVASYLVVPDLQAAMARLEPEWVRAYLSDPHDLRPHLPESMPRFDLEPGELDTIVSVFEVARASVAASPAPSSTRVAQGEALFTERGCTTCHTFGALHPGPGLPHAPDLAHTRARMTPDHVLAWLMDPKAVSGSATMPPPNLGRAEALAVCDYLLLADPGWTDASPLGAGPEPTARPVTWTEVEERVFGKICVHCHMDPAQNEGRAGPGNAGGFGWAATGIELQTYEGVVEAADRIPAALLRRRDEAHRDAVKPGERPAALTRPDKPGMPLGLPPLPDEDIALVLGWIEQGTPR
jgi:mono/diheme cytochrome c family protein